MKGFWHLIKAAALVRNKMPELNLRLMIIGEGRYEVYKKLVGELGMEEAVLFTGVQSNPFALLRKADAYALTSQSEGFPNALIEAMAVGLPCVSVNCLTGPAEILHEAYEDCRDRHQTYFADYGILTGVFPARRTCGQRQLPRRRETLRNCLLPCLPTRRSASAIRRHLGRGRRRLAWNGICAQSGT